MFPEGWSDAFMMGVGFPMFASVLGWGVWLAKNLLKQVNRYE